MPIYKGEILGFIGASGCGKSTALKVLNRMNDEVRGCRVSGSITLDGEDIYGPDVETEGLRKRVGMVWQKPNPFPTSIHENIAGYVRRHGRASTKPDIDERVEKSLRLAGLFEQVKDRMGDDGYALSGGQQQRLCIARAMALEPEVLLLDEPCASLDQISSAEVEESIRMLAGKTTIVIVTHNMEQAARLTDRIAHFHIGEMLSYGPTRDVFTAPDNDMTAAYVGGHYG